MLIDSCVTVLGQYIRVILTDGKVIDGMFSCMDNEANIVLRQAEHIEEG